MTLHLFLGRASPPEYLDLFLCREVYHCTPNELDEVDAARIAEHLTCLEVEARLRR